MKKFRKNKLIIICLVVFGVFLFNSAVGDTLLVNWPPSPPPFRTQITEDVGIGVLIKYFYEWAIALGGLAVFIVLVIAGFQYLTSVGDPTKMKEAKGRIENAGLGLILLLSSWLILTTINPALTTFPRLTLNLGGLIEKLSCKDDEDCQKRFGEHYICHKDKRKCIPQLEIKPKLCQSVLIKWGGKPEGISINLGESQKIKPKIEAGHSFYFSVIPEGCSGVLGLYPDIRCRDDREQVIVTGSRKAEARVDTSCIKFEKVPEW